MVLALAHFFGFTDDLQAFLMEAFEESFERQMQQVPAEAEIKKRSSKTMEGLDALIRSTVEPKVQFDQHATRRLTLQFDERIAPQFGNFVHQKLEDRKSVV